MFSLDHIPDDILLEIFAQMRTSEVFASVPASSPTAALRGTALTCWRLYHLTKRALLTEMWWTGKAISTTTNLMLAAIHPSNQRAHGPRYAHTARKVVISILLQGPLKDTWRQVHRHIYAALPRFTLLKELVLADTFISARETYRLLVSLPALRIFAALRCILVDEIEDFGVQTAPTPPAVQFDLGQLKLTHFAVSVRHSNDPNSLYLIENMLCIPTLQEVDLLWTKEMAVAFMRRYSSLPISNQSAVLRSLSRLTLRIPELDRVLVELTISLFHKWPQHPTYNGPLIVGRENTTTEVHLQVGKCPLGWQDRMPEGDIRYMNLWGPSTQHVNTALAGSLAPVSSYEGPLSAVGLIISPSPVIYGGNLISKQEWARVERTPEPLGVEALSKPRLESWKAVEADTVDSGLKRLTISGTSFSGVVKPQFISPALTLLAIGRISSTALPNSAEFIPTATTTRTCAVLQHIDLYIPTFDLEALHAVRVLFWRSLESLVLCLPEYPSNALHGVCKALVHEKSIERVVDEFLAHMPCLRSISILNCEKLEKRNLGGLTVDDIHQDVKEYTILWGSFCPTLREVQMDGARFCRRWEGDKWLKTHATHKNRGVEPVVQMY